MRESHSSTAERNKRDVSAVESKEKRARQENRREERGPMAELRRLLAESLGTFILTLVAAGGEVIAAVSGGKVSAEARAIAPGLVVMAMIYTLGRVSGAHINPAVTFAFALRRVFPLARVPGYWLAQYAGATFAATVLERLFGPTAELGRSTPHGGTFPAVVMEMLLTGILVLVILNTATKHSLVGPNAALAVGGTVALCGLFAAPVSGASMNPARSLGPALVARSWHDGWIYLAGPFAGAALAVACTWLLRGKQDASEEEAASGQGKE
jgi:aquaporin Z